VNLIFSGFLTNRTAIRPKTGDMGTANPSRSRFIARGLKLARYQA